MEGGREGMRGEERRKEKKKKERGRSSGAPRDSNSISPLMRGQVFPQKAQALCLALIFRSFTDFLLV